MPVKNFNLLNVNNVYSFENEISNIKPIDGKIFINCGSKLLMLDKTFSTIRDNIVPFFDAIEYKDEKIALIYKKNKDLIYEDVSGVKHPIELTKDEEITDVFLFYDISYGAIQLKDGSFDIYSLFARKVLCNLQYDKEILFTYKYNIKNELIIAFCDEIIFLDMKTLTVKNTTPIEDPSFYNLQFFKGKIYLLYDGFIKVLHTNQKSIDIKIPIKERVTEALINHQLQSLILHSRTSVYLFHLETSSFFPVFSLKGFIKNLFFLNGYLYILNDNQILQIDISKGDDELQKYLTLKDINKVCAIIRQNPFLICNMHSFKKLQTIYKEHYDKISNKLLMNKVDEAYELFRGFEIFNSYKKQFEYLISHKDVFVQLANSFRRLEFQNVFEIIDSYPLIQDTTIAKKVSNDWDQALERFILYLLKNKFSRSSKEYKALEKYLKDSKKEELVLYIIENQEVILNAVNTFRQKHFMAFANILEKNPLISDLPFTKKLFKMVSSIYDKSLKYMELKNYEEAKKKLKLLRLFEIYRKKVKKLNEKINLLEAFDSALMRDDITRCRIYLEQHKEIFENSKYEQMIIDNDLSNIDLAFLDIYNNDLKNAYLKVEDLFKFKMWSIKLNFLMRQYYIKEYEMISKNLNTTKLQNFAQNYFKTFGYLDKSFGSTEINKNKTVNRENNNYPKSFHEEMI